MWPLYLVFIFATAAPQQQSAVPTFQQKLPPQMLRSDDQIASQFAESQRNTCYTMRSYLFHQQDGQAPVPAGMTTCTPANVLQQRRVMSGPNDLFVPLGMKVDEVKIDEQK
jgi:hypothetical protein